MRVLAFLLSALVAWQLAVCPYVFAADESSSTPSTQVKCNKIGALLLTDGLAIMGANTIEIVSKTPDGKSQSQLHGRLIKSDSTGGGNNYAYFDSGAQLGNLDAGSCPERVDLTDGQKILGHITDLTGQTLTIGGQTVLLKQVQSIHSPHVFRYQLANGGQNANFSSTCIKVAAGNGHINHLFLKSVIAVTLLAGIACAIAIPVAVSSHHHHNKPPSSSGGNQPPPTGMNGTPIGFYTPPFNTKPPTLPPPPRRGRGGGNNNN